MASPTASGAGCLNRRRPEWLPAFVAIVWAVWLTTAWASALSAADSEQPPTPPLEKGVFLVASPNLPDPNFRQTVVLIAEYGPEGALGVIVNRPTRFLLSEALPSLPVLKGTSYVLFFGGPVQPNAILMLFHVLEKPSDTSRVLEGIYLGGNLEALEHVVTRPKPTETFRAYAGYAGWAPGQLDFEMAMGSWAVVPADAASIFNKDPHALWADLIQALSAPRVIRSRRANEEPSEPSFRLSVPSGPVE